MRYPLARYHAVTGRMRLIMSPAEEEVLGPEWGAAQVDVNYPPNPPPIIEEELSPPVFSIEVPLVK